MRTIKKLSGGTAPINSRLNGRVYFAAIGFLVGAYFGASTGVASGGDAQNGWLIFGCIGSALLYLLTFTVQPPKRKTSDSKHSANENAPVFSNLSEVVVALEEHVMPFEGIEREARFFEFFVRNAKYTGNFAPREIARAVGKNVSTEDIERAQAIARRLATL